MTQKNLELLQILNVISTNLICMIITRAFEMKGQHNLIRLTSLVYLRNVNKLFWHSFILREPNTTIQVVMLVILYKQMELNNSIR